MTKHDRWSRRTKMTETINIQFSGEEFNAILKYQKSIKAESVQEAILNAIEELSKPRWIPVTERLPEEEKTVLAWGKKHQCVLFDWMHDNKWCFGDEDYWMPLPEPPTIIESGVSES